MDLTWSNFSQACLLPRGSSTLAMPKLKQAPKCKTACSEVPTTKRNPTNLPRSVVSAQPHCSPAFPEVLASPVTPPYKRKDVFCWVLRCVKILRSKRSLFCNSLLNKVSPILNPDWFFTWRKGTVIWTQNSLNSLINSGVGVLGNIYLCMEYCDTQVHFLWQTGKDIADKID